MFYCLFKPQNITSEKSLITKIGRIPKDLKSPSLRDFLLLRAAGSPVEIDIFQNKRTRKQSNTVHPKAYAVQKEMKGLLPGNPDHQEGVRVSRVPSSQLRAVSPNLSVRRGEKLHQTVKKLTQTNAARPVL